MPPLSLMIKPASGNCNMRCRYCFYADEVQNRKVASYGIMTVETLEKVVCRALERASGNCTFVFQGGEPTLRGLDFFQTLIELEKRYNKKSVTIHHAIQTNGYALDKSWVRFFRENHFLVGLSLDGDKEIHDGFRVDALGRATHKRVMHAAQMLTQNHVDFNILTTVTAQVARQTQKVFQFYLRNNLRYQQYVPCLDPLDETRGRQPYSLTPELYEQFLKCLFDLWYGEVTHGNLLYIRYFENLVGMVRGETPENCSMLGFCPKQYVVEADGSVYPCDFYVLDVYRLGSLTTDSFEQIDCRRDELGFTQKSLEIDARCKACRWYGLCRCGCRRERTQGRNDFCTAYQSFFEYAIPRLQKVAWGRAEPSLYRKGR